MRVIFGRLVYFQNDSGLTDFAMLPEFTRLQGARLQETGSFDRS